MQDRSLSIANTLAKIPRILNEFPAAVLSYTGKSNTSEVKCLNWMMEEHFVSKNAPTLILRNRLERCSVHTASQIVARDF